MVVPFAPAVGAMLLDALMRSLELKGKITGDPAMEQRLKRQFFIRPFCMGGSLFPAIWLNARRDRWVTLNYWFGLTLLNIALTVPGCSIIWS